MPKTIYYTALSLDGFLADQYHSLDWLLRQEMDEDGPFNYAEFIADIGAIVMGSSTYTWVVEQQAGTGEGWVYQQPTWVMTSRNLEPMEGADIRFASGDIRPVHAEASEAAGNRSVWIVGGGDLAGQFADANLLDELIVSIAPVTLGEGAPLLPRRLDLRLIEAARNRNFNCARYEVLGPLP
jgi:dihydrofolate reductase